MDWLQRHLDYTFRPLLGEPWILDVDTTVKPLYGRQEGAVVGYKAVLALGREFGHERLRTAVASPALSSSVRLLP